MKQVLEHRFFLCVSLQVWRSVRRRKYVLWILSWSCMTYCEFQVPMPSPSAPTCRLKITTCSTIFTKCHELWRGICFIARCCGSGGLGSGFVFHYEPYRTKSKLKQFNVLFFSNTLMKSYVCVCVFSVEMLEQKMRRKEKPNNDRQNKHQIQSQLVQNLTGTAAALRPKRCLIARTIALHEPRTMSLVYRRVYPKLIMCLCVIGTKRTLSRP